MIKVIDHYKIINVTSLGSKEEVIGLNWSLLSFVFNFLLIHDNLRENDLICYVINLTIFRLTYLDGILSPLLCHLRIRKMIKYGILID